MGWDRWMRCSYLIEGWMRCGWKKERGGLEPTGGNGVGLGWAEFGQSSVLGGNNDVGLKSTRQYRAG